MSDFQVRFDNSTPGLLIALFVVAFAAAQPVSAQDTHPQLAGSTATGPRAANRAVHPPANATALSNSAASLPTASAATTAQPAGPTAAVQSAPTPRPAPVVASSAVYGPYVPYKAPTDTLKASPSSTENTRPILEPRTIDADHGPADLGGSFMKEEVNEQIAHITVGRSILVDTKHRLTRVYITNPEVIDSYTASPTEVVITAKKAGNSTLILWDESGDSKSYIVSSDLNVEMLSQSMKQALPEESIKVVGDETRVILSGTVSTAAVGDSAVKIASLYSKEVSNSLLVNTARVKQVRLEVKIIEVDRSKINQFGFNFFSTGGNNTATTSTQQYSSAMTVTPPTASAPKTVSVTNPLNFSLYSNRFNIGATLQDLETMQVAQILAEPDITTMSGEKASFLAGGEFPFPIVQGSSTGGTSVSISFRPYGVKLDFTPWVNSDGTVDLKVAPEVSALDFSNAVTIAGYTIPALSTRRADTEVVLKSGQTFGIAGLLDRRTTDLYSKTPGVANVPILGQLFKSKGVTHSDSELIVIVTPFVVDPVNGGVPPVTEPKLPVPVMNNGTFDKELPKGATKP